MPDEGGMHVIKTGIDPHEAGQELHLDVWSNERPSRDLTVVSLAYPHMKLVISVFQHGSFAGPCIVYSQRCSLLEVEMNAAVARRALSRWTARAMKL